MTEVEQAERDVATSKRRFQESLRLAGETGTRLAADVRKKATPAVMVTVAASVALVAGVTFAASRSRAAPRRRVRREPSFAGDLTRAAGGWVLRTLVLHVVTTMAARFLKAPAELGSGDSSAQENSRAGV